MKLKPCPIPDCSGRKGITLCDSYDNIEQVYCESCHLTVYSVRDWQSLPRIEEIWKCASCATPKSQYHMKHCSDCVWPSKKGPCEECSDTGVIAAGTYQEEKCGCKK